MTDPDRNYSETPNSSPDRLADIKAALDEHDALPNISWLDIDWLVAEVERLRVAHANVRTELLAFGAELTALREQRCETCRWFNPYDDGSPWGYCNKLQQPFGADFGCCRWARREP